MLELMDWQAQKVCPSGVLTNFSSTLYPRQKLGSFSHYLCLNKAKRPMPAIIAAPAVTTLYAEAHTSELAYSKLLNVVSVP